MSVIVSHEYLLGIKEGRELLKASNYTLQDMVDVVDNIKSTMKEFSAGPVKDMLKGELDFWKLQIKKVQNND